MSDLRIQPLPPEAAQRPIVEPARPAAATASSASAGNANGGTANGGGSETPRDQYISPFISIDPTSGLVITQYRNSESGELLQQYPSQKVVREYQNLQPAAVSPSGGRGVSPAPGQAADAGAQGYVATIGRSAPGNPAPVPAPAPTAAPTPAPAPAPVAAAPTGGVDKGSA